jgi:hypothetical protein
MTAKEQLEMLAPTLSEDQAALALRAIDEPSAARNDEDDVVGLRDRWRTFEDGRPQPDWAALIREDRDQGHREPERAARVRLAAWPYNQRR